ncbi:MAG: succinate dehydrogenase, hydrophobic membrane anchor protein [Gammaproteobacteria bacterium]
MKLRSPLGEVLGLGAAGDGPAHWWAQRASAVGVVLLTLWFLFSLAGLNVTDHAELSRWIATPLNSVLAVLLIAVTAYHSSLGIQEVIVDYVGGWQRIFSLLLAQFVHVVVAVVGIVAVLRMTFGDPA